MTDGARRRRQVNLQIASFVIESHDHPDVFVPGHALRLAIGEARLSALISRLKKLKENNGFDHYPAWA
jgi:hypothetical protein